MSRNPSRGPGRGVTKVRCKSLYSKVRLEVILNFSKTHTVFPCIVSAETSYSLTWKYQDFWIVSEFLCNKQGKNGGKLFKGGNYSREDTIQGNTVYHKHKWALWWLSYCFWKVCYTWTNCALAFFRIFLTAVWFVVYRYNLLTIHSFLSFRLGKLPVSYTTSLSNLSFLMNKYAMFFLN